MRLNWRHLVFLAGTLLALPTRAQTSAEIALFMPVEGVLEAGESQAWTFTAFAGAALSFVAETTSGDLDPVLTIADDQGNVLISNDDYDYPDSLDARLEAITIPRIDTYMVTVSAFGATSGEFRLTMLPGYSVPDVSEDFEGATRWSAVGSAQVEIAAGQLRLALAPSEQTGMALGGVNQPSNYFYAQVEITEVSGGDGWWVGMTLRQQGQRAYLYTVNSEGRWRFVARTSDGEQILRDWVSHPALSNPSAGFTLGVMALRDGFDFFYNGQFLGTVATTTLTEPGQIGLVVGTTMVGNQTSAQFDNLKTTVPVQIDSRYLLPQRLIVGEGSIMTRDLQRRLLIPILGEMTLTVPESSGVYSRPGVERFPLGRRMTFTNLALGTTFTLQAVPPGVAGCGLFLRAADATHYTLAYLDQTGGYGLSLREGDVFQPGIFGEQSATDAAEHHLLVIADAGKLHYYVDGVYAGSLDNPAVEGEVGNAVVNFEPITTTCRFEETWLWRWD